MEVAGLGKCSYVVGKRKVKPRVRGAERAVLYLG